MPSQDHIQFVTGKLAEPALRAIVGTLSQQCGFNYSILCMPISVAALMTPKWFLRHMHVDEKATRILIPGYLKEGLTEIESHLGRSIECGPKDLRDLPEYFGKPSLRGEDYGAYSIEIIAEINHANRMRREDVLSVAQKMITDGADVVDLGCDPSHRWNDIGDTVRMLVDAGMRVSIDSFDAWEVEQGARAGAGLVLSVNGSNLRGALEWGIEVVLIPDQLEDWQASLEASVAFLEDQRIPFRIDPILEPIGCGFAQSLHRYRETRRLFPEARMLMGIGNLTELTDVDSAGVNTLLLGYCQELQIGSVLTTEVISWAKSSVRECDLGRRLVHYAVEKKIPPKRLDDRLVTLRDAKIKRYDPSFFASLAASVKDNNFRIFVDGEQIHLISHQVHLVGNDPFLLMDQLLQLPAAKNVDASHAFYLGYELAKALTALQLGKNYEQDQALDWGYLTKEEIPHRLSRGKHQKGTSSPSS